MSDIPLPRLKRHADFFALGHDPGYWVTADDRWVLYRPIQKWNGGRRAGYWELFARRSADQQLLETYGLRRRQTGFATRQEALQALATMLSAEGLL